MEPCGVAPYAGAWIEMLEVVHGVDHQNQSLPTRERGLKSPSCGRLFPYCRSLPTRERGLKFFFRLSGHVSAQVAPYAGAWIEISTTARASASVSSLPTRERGLKSQCGGVQFPPASSLPTRERGLKSSVLVNGTVEGTVAPYAGAWIEICIQSLF